MSLTTKHTFALSFDTHYPKDNSTPLTIIKQLSSKAVLFLLFILSHNTFSQNPISGNQGFQILTEGNFTSLGSHHIHGPLGVGGNLVINSSVGEINMDASGSYIFPGDGTNSTGLLVKGSVTWTAGYLRVLNSKYIHIGNSTGSISGDNGVNQSTQVYPTATSYNNAKRIEGTIDQTPSPAVFQTVGFDFTTLFSNYRTTSSTLGGSANNVQLYNSSNVAISGNNVSSAQSVRINSLNTGVNYLNLTASSLTNITEMVFNDQPNASKVLIINVPIAANYTWNNVNMAGLSGSANGSYILWNFYGSTTYNLTINQAALIVGTVYAPNMNLIKTGTGDIDGNLIAKTAQLGIGEIHDYQFANDLTNFGNCSCTGNLLTNGSFENGVTGWSSSGGSAYNGTGYQVCGSYNGYLQATTTNAWMWQQVSASAGSTYYLNFWGGTHDPSFTHYVRIGFYNSSNSLIGSNQVNVDYDVDTNNNLSYYAASATAPTGTSYLRVEAFANGDYIKLDQMCLSTTNTGGSQNCTAPNISATSNSPLCIGSTIHFETQSTTSGVSYSWTGPNGFTSTNEQYPCVNSAALINGGTYTAMATLNGCTATATVNVVVNNTVAPTPPIVTNVFKCSAGTATFTATGCAGTVKWYDADWLYLGSGTSYTTVSLSQNALYLVECQTATCLSEKGNVYVIFQSAPTPTITASASSVCAGQSVSLTANSNCSSTSPNLLVNAGFEGISASPWWMSAGTVTRVNNNARTGTYSLSVIGNDVGFGTKVANLSPNTSYTLTGYMKASTAGQNAYLQVSGHNGSSSWVQSSVTSVGTSYTQFSVTFTTGATETSADLGVWRFGSGTVYADDFVLTQNISTCTYSWSPGGATTQAITVNPTANTTYTVTVGMNGCTATASTAISVTGTAISVNSPTICNGNSATLTASGCTGTVSWSNGVTAASITVNPTTTTSYTASCTPAATNLLTNPNFETAVLTPWSNWGNASVTSTASERQNGTYGGKVTATFTQGGFGQKISANTDEVFTLTAWAKVNSSLFNSSIGFKFLNSSSTQVGTDVAVEVNATTFQQYTLTGTAPAGTAFIEVYAWSNAGAILYADNYVLTKAACTTSAISTVTISSPIAAPTAAGASRCDAGSVTLSASGCTGAYNWYAASTGGASLATTASYTTPNISTTTTYYVDCTSSSCTSSRASATATISGAPATPTATIVNTGCIGSMGSITVTNLPDGYSTNINGGAWTQHKNSYTNLAAGTYSIGYQGGGCNSYANFTVANSTDNPLLTLAKIDPTCSTTGSITVTGSGGMTGLGEATYQLWYGISGNEITALTSNANYPNTPSFATTLGIAEGYENALDNIGGKISGYIVPPTTGTYTFWVASDDYSEFWASTDANPANKSLLSSVTGYTGYREWNKFTSQKTVALNLTAGQIYYFEVLYKEGSGGDNVSLGWAKPGEATTVPSEVIPGKYLRPNIASSTTTPVYQYKIGSGAFQSSNTFTGLAAGTYTVTIQDAGGCTATSNITLTTTGGTTAPTSAGANRCGTGQVTLSASGCTGGTYNWYSAATGGTSLATTATYTTLSLSASTNYYVSCTISSCVSARTLSVATVNSPTAITATSNSPVCIGSAINLNVTGGSSYSWTGPSSFVSTVQAPSVAATAARGGIYSVTVTNASGCTSTATTNVVVPTIAISNIVVSSCTNQPLQDVATVSMSIAWTNAQSGDKIKVVINNKIEYIDVAAGATSPQTVTFLVPADGISNIPISASWLTFGGGNCSTLASFNAPAACSSDNLNCEKILYLCGDDKPNDADAFDHGFINYLSAVGANSVTGLFTKADATGYGLYTTITYPSSNTVNFTTLASVNLNDYTMIIVSPTTQDKLSADLLTALKSYQGGILMMNYAQVGNLAMSSNSSYVWQTYAYTNNTTTSELLNYDNTAGAAGYLFTIADFYSTGTGYLWGQQSSVSANTSGIYFYYPSSAVLSGVASHGARVYLGYHMNGIYANSSNGGVLPAPASSYLVPTKHFTLEGKYYFDQAIKNAATGIKITSITGDTKCGGATINLSSTGVGIVSYSWTGPNSFASTLQNPTRTNATAAMSGIYTLTVTGVAGCTATATANVVVNAVSSPTSAGGSRCGAGIVTLTANGCSGTSNWFTAATGGTSLGSGATYTTSNLSSTTNYYVDCTVAGCTSTTRTTAAAVINSIPTTPTASSNSPVAYGATINLTSSSTGATSYTWTGPDTFIANGQNTSIPASSGLNVGTYTITAAATGGCTATATTDVMVFSSEPGAVDCSVIPTLNFASPSIITGNAGALGTQYRFSNVLAGIDAIVTIQSKSHTDIAILDIDSPFSAYGGYEAAMQPIIDYNWINGGGYFDAPGDKSVTFKIDFVNGGTTTSTTIPLVTMTGLDIDGSGTANEVREFIQASGHQSFESQTTTTLTLSGNVKALGPITTYTGINESVLDVMASYFYPNVSSITVTYGANWGGATADFADYGLPNTDEARLNSLYFKCYSLSQILCNPVAAPIATGASRCGPGTVTLSASGCTSGTYNWYSTPTGGTSLASTASFTTPSITVTKSYYVECTLVGCTSSTRTEAIAAINLIPTAPTAAGTSICGAGPVTLSASGCTGAYNWYAASTGGASIATTASYTTPSISATKTYYVDCTSGSCTSSRTSATATILNIPVTPTATTVNTGCIGSMGSITVTNLPDGYSTNINGGAWTQHKNSYTDLAAGTYSIGYQGGGCNSYANFTVANSTDNPLLTLAKIDPTCSTTGNITVTGSGGMTGLGEATYQLWYGISGNEITALTSNANYPNTPSFVTTLGIAEGYENALDNIGGKISGYIVPPTTGTYTFWVASDDYSEFWVSTDANPANKSLLSSVTGYTGYREWNKYTSQKTAALNLTAGQIYYFEVLYKEGSGGDNVSLGWAKPGEATTVPSEVVPGKYLRPNIASSTTTPVYQYKIGSGAFQSSNTFTGLAAGTYIVTIQDAGGCTATSNITLTTSGSVSAPTSAGASRCGTGQVTLTASGCAGGTISWYSSATGGIALTTGTTYTTNSISTTTTYYIACSTLNCVSATRNSAVATVYTVPTATATSNSPIVGGTLNLSATGDGTYAWTGPNSFVSTLKDVSLSPATLAMGGTYTVTVSVNGCTATATTMVFIANNNTPGDIDCSLIPTLNFATPSLISGVAGEENAQYRFNNITTGTDAIVTIISKSHTDISITNIDMPAATYGGYDAAMQPLIDYNWINSGGSFDAAGEKSVTFKIDFVNAGTTTPKVIPNVVASGIDIDGSGDEVREFIQTTANQSHQIQTPTSLTLTGSSKATGSATNFTGINELALDAIVSFGYVNTSSITVTYGAIWNGSTTSFVDNANPNLSDETRLNSLYFKCENLNNTICDLVLPAPTTTPANRCGDGTVTIIATGCSGIYTWYNSATGVTAIGTGNTYTTPVLSNNYTYYVDCDAVGCTSTRTALSVTIYSLPTAPTVADKNNCGTGNITLSASGCTGGTIQWYASQTGTASLATGTSMTLTALSSSAVYFVACTDANACVSATRNYGLATINAFPKATATNINPTCLGLQSTDSGKILISQFKTNETYSWNTGATYNAGTATSPQVIPTNGEIFPSATAPASSVTYNVRIKNIENCFIDLPITITNTCTNCPVNYCEPPSSIVKTK